MRKYTKYIILISLIFSFLFAEILVFAEQSKNDSKAIKIGVTLPLTGTIAYVGENLRDGLILASEEIRTYGGVAGQELKLVIEDNAGEARQAVTTAKRLLELDKVDIIFSAFTHITQALKDIVAKANRSMFYAASLRSIATSNPLFFRIWDDGELQGQIAARAALLNGQKKIGYLGEINDICTEFTQAFIDEGKTHGISIVAKDEYLPGEVDLRSSLIKIARYKPDALFLCSFRDAHIVIRQMKELGLINIPGIFSWAPFIPASDTPQIRSLYEENRSVSVWASIHDSNTSPSYKSFKEKFRQRFSRNPEPYASYTYDALHFIARELPACIINFEVNQECLAQKLISSSYDGAAGSFTFGEKRLGNRKPTLIQVRAGKWEKIPLN